jgi:2-phospho-L-lactate guanylyltransferase
MRSCRQTEAVQATVRSFDEHSRTGDVLLDDGSVLAFPARAFDASGLRLLRLGQRVRLELDDDGGIGFLTIATLADPHAYD